MRKSIVFCSATIALLAIGLAGCEDQQTKQALKAAGERVKIAEEAREMEVKARQEAERARNNNVDEILKHVDETKAKLARVQNELSAAKVRIAHLEAKVNESAEDEEQAP